MSLSSSARRRLQKELMQLVSSPPEGIRVDLEEHDILAFEAWIQGPDGTPFDGGYFRLRFTFSSDFPASPPKCWFVTKIFHPNIAPSTGEVCVSTLKKDWKPTYGISHILVTIKCLLIYPNPESALHEEAGRLLLEQYDDFAKQARLMTSIHARSRPSVFNQAVEPQHDSKTSSVGTTKSFSSGEGAAAAAAVPLLHVAAPPTTTTMTKTTSRTSANDKDSASVCFSNNNEGLTGYQSLLPLQPSGLSNSVTTTSSNGPLSPSSLGYSSTSPHPTPGSTSPVLSASSNGNGARGGATTNENMMLSAATSKVSKLANSSSSAKPANAKKRGLKRL